jgi:hypothetical protein
MVVQAPTSLPRGMWVQRLRQSTWLTTKRWITVAGQHRTHTGFAFMPSHPGVGRLNRLSLEIVKCLFLEYHSSSKM